MKNLQSEIDRLVMGVLSVWDNQETDDDKALDIFRANCDAIHNLILKTLPERKTMEAFELEKTRINDFATTGEAIANHVGYNKCLDDINLRLNSLKEEGKDKEE